MVKKRITAHLTTELGAAPADTISTTLVLACVPSAPAATPAAAVVVVVVGYLLPLGLHTVHCINGLTVAVYGDLHRTVGASSKFGLYMAMA